MISDDTDVSEKLKELINEVKILRIEVEQLKNGVNTANNVLVEHINFIDNIFNTVKRPFFFIMNKINKILISEEENIEENSIIDGNALVDGNIINQE